MQPWLSTEELQVWVREAPDKESYQRRLAVWLTQSGPFPAHQIAEWLCVSQQAIWLWIGQYNRQGPEGLERQGRGGRRWAYLSLEEEATLLRRFQRQAAEGKLLTAQRLHAPLVERTGRKLTVGYVYGLLHRHEWRKLGPRPRHPRANPEAPERFKKNSPDSWKPRGDWFSGPVEGRLGASGTTSVNNYARWPRLEANRCILATAGRPKN